MECYKQIDESIEDEPKGLESHVCQTLLTHLDLPEEFPIL